MMINDYQKRGHEIFLALQRDDVESFKILFTEQLNRTNHDKSCLVFKYQELKDCTTTLVSAEVFSAAVIEKANKCISHLLNGWAFPCSSIHEYENVTTKKLSFKNVTTLRALFIKNTPGYTWEPLIQTKAERWEEPFLKIEQEQQCNQQSFERAKLMLNLPCGHQLHQNNTVL